MGFGYSSPAQNPMLHWPWLGEWRRENGSAQSTDPSRVFESCWSLVSSVHHSQAHLSRAERFSPDCFGYRGPSLLLRRKELGTTVCTLVLLRGFCLGCCSGCSWGWCCSGGVPCLWRSCCWVGVFLGAVLGSVLDALPDAVAVAAGVLGAEI